MAYKLRATSTFAGTEGFVRSGDIFEAANEARANKLVNDLKLAEYANEDAETSEIKALDEYSKDELKERAATLEIEGYKSMNKEQLVSAIQENDPDYNGGNDSGNDSETAGETNQ